MKFTYTLINSNGEYDIMETFDSAEEAIYEAVINKNRVAVLDALSLEFYGEI